VCLSTSAFIRGLTPRNTTGAVMVSYYLLIFFLAEAVRITAGAGTSVLSCSAEMQAGMAAGDPASRHMGGRPAALVQMKSPRKSTVSVLEEQDQNEPAAVEAPRKHEPQVDFPSVTLQKGFQALLTQKLPMSFDWNHYATSILGVHGIPEPAAVALPAALLISIILSCAVSACLVACYRPKRGKLDEQFEPVRLGLPADYGCSKALRRNCL